MTPDKRSDTGHRTGGRKWVYILLMAALLALLALTLPLEDMLRELHAWADEHGEMAAWALGALFAIGVLLLLPVSAVVLLTGFMLGLAKGFFVIWVAGLVSSTLAFLVGRTLARKWVERRLDRYAKLALLDQEIAKNGFTMVTLSRLATVLPFGPLSYAWGVSKVRFWDFVLGTNLGAIPPYFLFVYLGTTAQDVAAIIAGEVTLGESGLLVGIAGAAIALILVTLIARMALNVWHSSTSKL